MHMSDALVSPLVGGAFWAASATAVGIGSRRTAAAAREGGIPLMGVLGAFVFAAQMINFAIPGTGSSGHLGGGLLLAVLLGPHAAVVVMASILGIQALLFADGGILALGCNIFNLGILPAFLAYPLIYRPLARRPSLGIPMACMAGLQLGALGVVLQTTLSGLTALPFRTFLLTMLPIHLAIGLVEGLVTAALVGFLRQQRPELLEQSDSRHATRSPMLVLGGLTLLLGGWLSWYASAHPDGLEWAVQRVAGHASVSTTPVHSIAGNLQEKVSILPDYAPKGHEAGRADTSLAGLLGGLATLCLVTAIGWVLKRRSV